MQESLGITITNQTIKYAKVTRENNQINVTSFGIKFYDNLVKDINQIIEETGSENGVICTNTKDEKITYFSTFGLLSKNDTIKTINTEFETLCSDNHINSNAYEGKYVIVNDITNKDRNKVIYVYESKNDLDEIEANFGNAKIKSITPLATSIANIADIKKGENIMIVNIEDTTTITTILNQKIYHIDKIKDGMQEIIEKINEKENSYSKSYEICKNTTIYTMETSENDDPNNKYLPYIVPTLFNIVQEISKIKDQYTKIDRIYLTGLGTSINNIELYFQEYFQGTKCEILKPFFAENNNKINIKDYIEVNSAIAIALEGVDYGLKSLNFRTSNWKEDLSSLLHSDISTIGKKKPKGNKTNNTNKKKFTFNWDLKGALTTSERWLIRSCVTVLMIMIIYSVCAVLLKNQIDSKIKEAQEVVDDTKIQTAAVNSDDSSVNSKKQDYDRFKSELENANSELETKRGRKNQIPTLLNQIVYIIPKSVQLTKIDNKEKNGKQHITITAQSTQYEQLAYFKAKLKNNGYLQNVVSTEGTKEGEYVVTTIEGDLP